MCKHRSKTNTEKSTYPLGDCILQEIHSNTPNSTLELDEDGYCVAHSKKLGGIDNLIFNTILQEALKLQINLSFDGFLFNSSVEIKSIDNLGNVDFKYCNFPKEFIIEDCNIGKLGIDNTKVNMISISNAEMMFLKIENTVINSIEVIKSIFNNTFVLKLSEVNQLFYLKNSILRDTFFIEDSVFNSYSFSICDCELNSKTARPCFQIIKSKYDGDVDFTRTKFNHKTYFKNVEFCYNTIFNESIFFPMNNTLSGNYALEIDNLITTSNTNISFKGSELQKMFEYQVFFKLENILGLFYFENVFFNNIDKHTQEKFLSLSRTGQVTIGKGCLKYKYQTLPKSIPVKDFSKDIVIDLMNAFERFFVKNSGFNLGFEIVEKVDGLIKYIYFSDDESIKDNAQFEYMLQSNEEEFWQIFSKIPDITNKLSLSYKSTETTDFDGIKAINVMNTIVDLTSILTKIGNVISNDFIFESQKNDLLNSFCSALNFGGNYEIDIDNAKKSIKIVHNNFVNISGNNCTAVIGKNNNININN